VKFNAFSDRLDSDYTFERIIGIFIDATFGDLTDERTPFEVPVYLQQAMWALVRLGYARREPNGFQWTDQIAPIMRAAYFWTEDGESLTTLDKERAAQLTEAMWRAIPVWRRHYLARWIIGRSEMDLFIYLFRRWNGTRLSLFERKLGNITLPSGHIDAMREISSRLIAIRSSHPF
jgi:hypothetical protein